MSVSEFCSMVGLCLLVACSKGDYRPRHHVFITDDIEGQSEKLSFEFEQWVQNAILFPNSEFRIYRSGDLLVRLLVPERWGNNTRGKKHRWLADCRHVLNTLQERSPAKPIAEEPLPPGIEEVFLLSGGKRWTFTPSLGIHSRTLILVDVSGSSRLPETRAVILSCLDAFLRRSQLLQGSQFVIYTIGDSYRGAERRFSWIVPQAGLTQRGLALLSVREALRTLDLPPSENASAIAEAVAKSLTETGRPDSLYLITDLHQSNHRFHFASQPPKVEGFLSWARGEGLLDSSLKGTTVQAIGVHNAALEVGFTAHRAHQITRVWEAFFREMGATDIRFATHAVEAFENTLADKGGGTP